MERALMSRRVAAMPRTDRRVSYSPTGKLEDVTPEMAAAGIEAAFVMLRGRWKIRILFHLFGGAVLRFSELERAMPGISPKVLAAQLRELERDGLVHRTLHPEVPPRVDYGLTPWGEALCPILDALLGWEHRGRAAPDLAQPAPA
jgi:DNA-binding HxlR family transcriptional regulator